MEKLILGSQQHLKENKQQHQRANEVSACWNSFRVGEQNFDHRAMARDLLTEQL